MKSLQRLLFCALIACPAAEAGTADCTLKKFASFETKPDVNMVLIKAKVDDKEVWAALDTGAPFNMIDNKLVAELKLPTNYGTLSGVDAAGHTTSIVAVAHTVELDNFTAKNVSFLIGGRESDDGKWDIEALFGSNLLEANDLELDLAHNKVNLFSSDHCSGQGVYWAREWVPIPIRIQQYGHIYLPVTLNGVDTYAMLDTGSSLTLVDKKFAERRLDVPVNGGKDKLDGYVTAGSGTKLAYYEHVFDLFDIGGIAFRNAKLNVSRDRSNDDSVNRSNDPHVTLRDEEVINAPITLGLQHLNKLRLYFSFKEHMLYVTPANAQ